MWILYNCERQNPHKYGLCVGVVPKCSKWTFFHALFLPCMFMQNILINEDKVPYRHSEYLWCHYGKKKGIRGGDAASASHSCGRHSRHPPTKATNVSSVLLCFAQKSYCGLLRKPCPTWSGSAVPFRVPTAPPGLKKKNPTLPLILPKSKLEITKQKDALYFGIFGFFSESATLTQFHYYK